MFKCLLSVALLTFFFYFSGGEAGRSTAQNRALKLMEQMWNFAVCVSIKWERSDWGDPFLLCDVKTVVTCWRNVLPVCVGCLGLFTWLAACLRPSVQTAAAGPHAAQIGAGRPVHQHYCQNHNTRATERVTGGGSGSRDAVISYLTHPWWKGLVNKVQTIILQNASQYAITNRKYKRQEWKWVRCWSWNLKCVHGLWLNVVVHQNLNMQSKEITAVIDLTTLIKDKIRL